MTTLPGVLSAISAAAAVAVLLRPPPTALLARIGSQRGLSGRATLGRRLLPDSSQAASGLAPAAVLPVCLAVGAGCGIAVMVHSPVPVVGLAVATTVLVRRQQRRSARDAERVRRAAAVELCNALSAELRAGRTPREALVRAAAGTASDTDLCPAAVIAAQNSGDVAAALTAAARDGATSLHWLAACWQVAEEQGAGLAAAAERLAEHGNADEALRQEVSVQLAGPRATAVLLALLPAVGVLLGTGLGADPLDVLLRTPWGVGCLVLGTLLAATGVGWTERIARMAETAT